MTPHVAIAGSPGGWDAAARAAMRAVIAITIATACAAGRAGASPQVPAPPQSRPVAITGGFVHTVSGADIPGGTVVFDRGVIVAAGAGIQPPAGAEIIDASGKHVYPGLFAAYSTLGLREIDAARATNDMSEIGDIHPEVRADIAYNPDNEHIPVTRSNGILTALTCPQGGLVSGRAAVVRLDAWTMEEAVVKSPAALQVIWPAAPLAAPEWDAGKRAIVEKTHDERVARIRRAFADARAWMQAHAAPARADLPQQAIDQRWAAMVPALRGEIPVMIFANTARDIEEAVAWALDERIRTIILGAAEADPVMDLLVRNDIPVIITDVLREPVTRDAGYDQPFALAGRLRAAGVRFAIGSAGGFGEGGAGSAWNLRNLPYHAAMSAAFGLPADEALKAITLDPARILGLEDQLGSIQPGRRATLFIANGDILEIPTRVEAAWIDGRRIDLDNRHETLYRKYREKYRRQGQ